MKSMYYMAAIAITTLFSANSHAELKGTLTYLQPYDSISSTDSAVVNVRLTLNDDSDSLNFTRSENLNNWLQFANEQLANHWDPAFNTLEFVHIEHIYLNTWFECSGTFTASCSDGPPYNFDFNNQLLSGEELWNIDLALAPGESIDYNFGVFTPSHGPVAADTYEFYRAGFTLNFAGYTADDYDENGELKLDENGWTIQAREVSYDLATTCPQCAFTRTVVAAVPEPSSYALMGLGLGILAYSARRRKARKIQ
ncbi:PEP-CTERM sorting domain-containing protein [Methylobacillus caricis]|uniref:PEP-CTERM sorting domain-containing protein n=1 Tax=Methylobacillus caricis TaxID=1971611 RepID=UPI001CFFC957|nr:PEP-CTERM sorting domain-containing protein [Methylobacillus caricis]MCB5188595.1 PEP-CTERM sorting domain-containing protein [Methylobacillus caricis]